jgi:hypothetical protein
MIGSRVLSTALLMGALFSGCFEASLAKTAAPRAREIAETPPPLGEHNLDGDPELSGHPGFLFRAGRRL